MGLNATIARCGFGIDANGSACPTCVAAAVSVPVLSLPDSTRLVCATPPHHMAHAPFSIAING